jgi:hypothetical protein
MLYILTPHSLRKGYSYPCSLFLVRFGMLSALLCSLFFAPCSLNSQQLKPFPITQRSEPSSNAIQSLAWFNQMEYCYKSEVASIIRNSNGICAIINGSKIQRVTPFVFALNLPGQGTILLVSYLLQSLDSVKLNS